MKMKRKRRKSKDMMDDKAFMRAITRLRKGDQYLKRERGQTDNQSDLAGYALYSLVLPSSLGST